MNIFFKLLKILINFQGKRFLILFHCVVLLVSSNFSPIFFTHHFCSFMNRPFTPFYLFFLMDYMNASFHRVLFPAGVNTYSIVLAAA